MSNDNDRDITGRPESGTEEIPSKAGMWDTSVTTSYGDTVQSDNDAQIPAETVPADTPFATDNGGRPAYPVWINIMAIIGVFFASWYIGWLAGLIAGSGGDNDGPAKFLHYLVWYGLTIGFAWWITTRKGTVIKPFSFSLKKSNPTLILWGLVLVMVTSMVIAPLIDLMPGENMERLSGAIGTGGWAMLITIVLVPILEEILFRGFIQQELVNGYGRVKGLLMAAAVFSMVHFIPQQVLNAFLVGIILGYIYIRSGSLTPAILIHAINNAIAYITMQLFGFNLMLTKSLFGSDIWFWFVYGLCCVVFILAGWKLIAQLRRIDMAESRNSAV